MTVFSVVSVTLFLCVCLFILSLQLTMKFLYNRFIFGPVASAVKNLLEMQGTQV